ncbi:hypothetical protein ACFWGR_12425 [Streptomyces sp. NPDC060311]|uniref:hypothetical protein n=1 Tax=Streptomyces sp. NPDC060311 TaxID=3347096 RepID=UPI00364D9640
MTVAQYALARRVDEGLDEGAVRQAEQAPGRLGGQPRVQRMLVGVSRHLRCQAVAQPGPVGGVGQPVAGDGRARRGDSHGLQVGPAHEPSPAQFRRTVRPPGHGP